MTENVKNIVIYVHYKAVFSLYKCHASVYTLEPTFSQWLYGTKETVLMISTVKFVEYSVDYKIIMFTCVNALLIQTFDADS